MAVAAKNGTKTDLSTPNWHASAKEVQKYGDVTQDLPHPLSADVRKKMVDKLNQLLADSIAIRDMYKKHHWQVGGPTFYQLHLLLDKHYEEQANLVDMIAERIMALGGISIAMAPDVAEMTAIPRPPKGREDVPTQLSRLLQAHEIILRQAHDGADAADEAGDDGTNDLLVSNIIRTGEPQVWFLAEHLAQTDLSRPDK
ncbi:MAG: DNA starvation/stationary phase protection protein [Sphingomicrobium sp.]